jgi:hypothetical protein
MHRPSSFLGIILIVILALILSALPVQAQSTGPRANEACASPSWAGNLYNNPSYSGEPIHIVCRRLIDFIWGTGVPFREIPADNFSMRWTSSQVFPEAGRYQIKIVLQGGVNFYINNQPVITSPTDTGVLRTLTADYDVTTPGVAVPMLIEHTHGGGSAQIRLDWSLMSGNSAADHQLTQTYQPSTFTAGGGNVWWIQHWNNPNWSGDPKALGIAVADGISFDYYLFPTAVAGFPRSNWSSRWTRAQYFPAGDYTFTMRVVDSGRLLIDGNEVINMQAASSGSATATVTLTEGRHVIVMEHVKYNSERAFVFLTWDPPIGTMLRPDGCNAVEVAGDGANAALCAGSGPATFSSNSFQGSSSGTFADSSGGAVAPSTTSSTTTTSSANITTPYDANAGGTNAPANTTSNAITAPPINQVTLPVIVRAGPLFVRPQPDKNSGQLMTIHQNESYTAVGRSGDGIWLQLNINGQLGWSMLEFLTPSGDVNILPITDGSSPSVANTTTQTVQTVTIGTTGQNQVVAPPPLPLVRAKATSHLNLRLAPDANSQDLGNVAWGEEVKIIGKSADGQWLQVVLGDGRQGWAAASWFSIIEGDLSLIPVTG